MNAITFLAVVLFVVVWTAAAILAYHFFVIQRKYMGLTDRSRRYYAVSNRDQWNITEEELANLERMFDFIDHPRSYRRKYRRKESGKGL